MIYILNRLFLFTLKAMTSFGRGQYLKKCYFNTKRILNKNFKESEKFIFIQIGANDGVSFDFLYDFVIKRKSIGIVLEPIPSYFYQLKENYKNFSGIHKINLAVHPFENKVKMYNVSNDALSKYPDWAKGIASVLPEHYKKTNIKKEDIDELIVNAKPLMQIISPYPHIIEKLDYLQIDTEGFDFEVLKMIDFKLCKPSIIKFEFYNLKFSEKNEALKMLQKMGYYLLADKGDMLAIDLKKVLLF